MNEDFWQRQDAAKPLFPDLLWSRPENRSAAGKLLIAGGNAHEFAAPGEAYNEAAKAGVGTARVLLPDALQKTVGPILEAGEFAPSTKTSGSFSQKALDDFLVQGNWADGVLLAGDFGRNAETAILLEKFLAHHHGQITLTRDACDYASSAPYTVLQRADTLLVLSLSQLQRLGIAAKVHTPITFGMDLLRLVAWLHDFTLTHKPFIITKHLDTIFVAVDGQVSTTKLAGDLAVWRVKTAAHAAVWWLQNPTKPFESLTTAVVQDAQLPQNAS
ncbi:MAG TPA: hypothetical protein VIM53_03025 [Candidatus Saccharimonadales bacterium]